MYRARIHVLGALEISGSDNLHPVLPPAVHQLVAVLVAAGPDGVDRDDLAVELWHDPLPGSWKSALRNRMTAARRVLGPDAILNTRARVRLASHMTVDSWDLIAHNVDSFGCRSDPFAFLDGEPLVDIDPSPLVLAHIDQVTEARAALVQRQMTSGVALTPFALHSLRNYQRQHPLDRTVTCETIRAFVRSGELHPARQIIDELHSQITDAQSPAVAWIHELDSLLEVGTRRRRREDHSESPTTVKVDPAALARRELFMSAAKDEAWNLAFDLAMAGLPADERWNGDPARIELLEAVPAGKLERRHQLTLALALARNLSYVGRDEEAFEAAAAAQRLAMTAGEELTALTTSVMIGRPTDERTPIPVPDAITTGPIDGVDMRSLQVVVMNHLERQSYEAVTGLERRFARLVEAGAEPYRRWHLLLMQSMKQFVDGHITEAAEAAQAAYDYASVFDITDAETALIGQLSNANQVHAGFSGIDDVAVDHPDIADTTLGLVLQAIRRVPTDGGEGVDRFLRSYDIARRARPVVPLVALAAPHASDPAVRAAVADRLRHRTGTSAILGSGLVHLGPVDRILAKVVDNDTERAMHLVAAIHVADRQRTRLWQVVCRLDLAQATGVAHHREQAIDLVTTPELQQIVDDRAGEMALSGGW